MKIYKKIILLLPLFILSLQYPAWAYIDPGTGSYVIQIVIAAVVGGAFAIKAFWQKIITILKNLFSGKGKKEK